MNLLPQQRIGAKNKSKRGNAMLLVMMMSVFSMGIWAVTLRTTRDAVDTQEFHDKRTEFEQRIVLGLAMAGELLEEESPTTLPFVFLFAGKDAKGPFYTRVEIRRSGSNKFTATARVASSQEVRRLPRNPQHF
ncbi:MAG: hypothetical protein COA70_05630 [Planctomycetota bacterium]|nr:MAG: hypothetical protein COA70_05630 [Planctomycetota bacterium]